MKSLLTVEELKAFEQRIADIYNGGEIRAPVHLSGGNEDALIDIFKRVEAEDWVFTSWRSHYHCLLKGVPPDKLMADICNGHSITLTYPEQRIVSSAIVGGILPIALGVALGIRRRHDMKVTLEETMERMPRVWAFVGDMTATTGVFHECMRYKIGHDLPLEIVIENNKKSVGTKTEDAWGVQNVCLFPNFRKYEYELPWPHSGAGKWVEF